MNQAAASEAELIAVMARQENGGEEARAAWGELFERHRKYLYVVASRAYGSFLGEDGTVDLVCDTFRRAFEWAGRQKNPDEVRARFAAQDADSTRRRVLGWLGAIAQQLFRDRFREESSNRDALSDFFEQWKGAEEHPAEGSDSMLLWELEVALGTLTGAQAEAVRASLPWYDVESRTFMLPRGEAARLCPGRCALRPAILKLPIPVVPTLTSRGLTGLVIALILAIEAPAGAQDTRRAPPPDFALVGGTVIDGTASPPRPKCTVVVRGGRIAAVGPDEAVPEGVTTIDVTGRCILPGMIDMHGHLYANDGKTIRNQFVPYALLYLAGGVTTVFSPGDFDPEGTVAFRESVKRGEAIGPRVLTAGPYFDHRPSHLGWIRGVNSADEARQLFDAWKGRIDGVKVYTSIQEPELVAVIGSAHEAGLRVVGHLDSVTATRAIELGIDGLEHGIFAMSELAGPAPDFPTTPWLAKLAALDVDAPPMKPLIASIVERHVVIDPTTVTFQELLPDFVAVAPDWKRFTAPESVKPIDDLFAMLRQEASKQGPQWLEAVHGALRKQNQFVKAVHDRGGIVVTGTDPVGVDLVPGYALHRELRNLVEAGFTPLEAIKAATQDAARALRRDAEIGTIAPGKVADLVVVGGNPAHAIDDVGRTEIVIAGGVRHDPAELRRLAEKGIK